MAEAGYVLWEGSPSRLMPHQWCAPDDSGSVVSLHFGSDERGVVELELGVLERVLRQAGWLPVSEASA